MAKSGLVLEVLVSLPRRRELEVDSSNIAEHDTTLIYTTVGEPVKKADQHALSSLQAYESRARVPSHHMRELARGKFLVNRNDITLLDCIGEGVY